MNRLLPLLILLFPAALCAQGVVSGRVVDAAGGDEYLDEPALAGVVALPPSAPPFNEITAMQWQDAFTALSNGEEPLVPLGGVINPVDVTVSRFVAVEGNGAFRIDDVPLGTRLGLAVKVGEMWWPYGRELKLTDDVNEREAEVAYFRLGADAESVAIETHRFEAQGDVREDLRYSPIQVFESLRITNPDPARAAMVEIELPVAVPPTTGASNLPQMYGSLLLYMQGWSAMPPVEREFEARAQTAWTFGVGGGMHGGVAPETNEAQFSAHNWHFLNRDPMLAMVGAGDTLYSVSPSSGGREASLIFRRPVPPAGALEIRMLHSGGVLHVDPTGKLGLRRSFSFPVRRAEAMIADGLTLAALVEGEHRRYYGQSEGEGTLNYPTNPEADPALKAGEQVRLVLGFNDDARGRMAAIESGEPPAPRPGGEESVDAGKRLDQSMVFKALAIIFGLAFVAALVGTVRKPREEQLKSLAELPSNRAGLVDALVDLDADYRKGVIPAHLYKEERRRMLNRLVEFDARREDKTDDGDE